MQTSPADEGDNTGWLCRDTSVATGNYVDCMDVYELDIENLDDTQSSVNIMFSQPEVDTTHPKTSLPDVLLNLVAHSHKGAGEQKYRKLK